MSRNKNKSKSEVEHLRGENKRLQKINRSLRRENKGLRDRAHFYEEATDSAVFSEPQKHQCANCGKGCIFILDLKYVKFAICDVCGHKKKIGLKSQGRHSET